MSAFLSIYTVNAMHQWAERIDHYGTSIHLIYTYMLGKVANTFKTTCVGKNAYISF